jgi:hypothetical protein
VPSIALLAAALALAGTPAPPPASTPVPLGRGELPLEAALEVRTARRATAAALAFAPAEDGSLAAHAEADEWEAWVVLAPSPGGARALSVRVLWRTPADEERVALSLAWPGAPSAVDRGLRFAPVTAERPLRVERGTPLLLRAGPAVLAGGPGLAAARIERAGAGVRATLLLDDASTRPFSTFTTCFSKLPEPEAGHHLAWGSFDPRREHPYAPRAAGQEDRLEAQLFPVAEGAAFLPVVLERWPRGARAAVVFTDHADRTDADALRAVLWGDSDPEAHGAGGFLGHGVALTRTFFVHGRGGLEEPAVAALADDLLGHGSEVGLHSITAERDDLAAVRRGLADAARWAPATWIDHEPYTNCEALSAQGWQASGPFGIREALVEGGIRWVWAAGDEGQGQPRIDDLLGGRPDEARAAIAPFALDPRLWTFRSSMFYAPPGVLAAALSDAELSKLEDARGLFVAHTYLGPSARTTHSAEHLPRLAVHAAPQGAGGSRGPSGRLTLDPALEAALARIEAHVREGRLASLTWSSAGDRLRALGEVELAYLPDGGLEISNRGATPLPGLTLAVPVPPEVELALEGGGALTRVDTQGGARVWFDLPAGGRAVLRATDHLLPLPFLAPP